MIRKITQTKMFVSIFKCIFLKGKTVFAKILMPPFSRVVAVAYRSFCTCILKKLSTDRFNVTRLPRVGHQDSADRSSSSAIQSEPNGYIAGSFADKSSKTVRETYFDRAGRAIENPRSVLVSDAHLLIVEEKAEFMLVQELAGSAFRSRLLVLDLEGKTWHYYPEWNGIINRG